MRATALLVSLLLPFRAGAATIAVLTGADTGFYRRYFSGFGSAATERVSAFRCEEGKESALIAQVKKVAPDLIVVLGPMPLRRLADAFPSTPILASRQPLAGRLQQPNLLVFENENPERGALRVAQALFPQRKTVGTLYNPKLSQETFDVLVAEAAKVGMRVAALKIDAADDARTLINAFAGKVDLFYWIRDATTSNPALLTTLYDFASRNAVPVLSPEPDHLARGALLSVTFDPFRLGEQVWQTAAEILKTKEMPKKPPGPGEGQEVVSVSRGRAAKFGIGPDAFVAFLDRALAEKFGVQVVP
jgi:ABC-type uncharacterized transport system substrate-binding protein